MKKNIYLARQDGTDLYKIGITKNDPIERLRQLQTGNAGELILTETFQTKHNFQMEAGVHAHFRLKRANSEWFTLDDEDVKLFYSICERLEHSFDILKEQNTYLKNRS